MNVEFRDISVEEESFVNHFMIGAPPRRRISVLDYNATTTAVGAKNWV